jgi:hypothetical protein
MISCVTLSSKASLNPAITMSPGRSVKSRSHNQPDLVLHLVLLLAGVRRSAVGGRLGYSREIPIISTKSFRPARGHGASSNCPVGPGVCITRLAEL